MRGRPASEVAIDPASLGLAAAVLALSNFMVVLDLTVANVSVPHIAGVLGVPLDQGAWVITSYSVAEAITVPLTGWLALRFGTVRLYLGCMAGFGVFSLLCGLAPTLETLVGFRIAQGVCGGLLMPLAQTLLFRVFPPESRAKAMLLWSMTTMLGPALGPNIGGFISDNMSWRWIFLLNIPIAIGCVVAGRLLLSRAETPTRKSPIDVVGLGLMVFWIGCLQIMLDIGRTHDWFQDPKITALAVTALVGFAAFLIWELTEEHPVVDLRVFRHRGFTSSVVALSLCFGAYFASIVVIPQWLQAWLGYTAAQAGFVTGCTAMAALTTSWLSVRVMAVADPRLMVSGAVAWLGCMALVRAQWTSHAELWMYAMPQVIQGFGMSFFMMPLTVIALGAVRPEETASAAGLQNFMRTIAIGISTALALTIWDNTQKTAHSELAARLRPEGTMQALSEAGFSTGQARLVVANLVDREATTLAVDHVFLITALVFFLCAAVVWLAPRPRPAGGRAGK